MVLIEGVIELDFKYRRKKKEYCIMVLALGTGTKGESILGPTPTARSLRLRNFVYVIKIINNLPTVIVVAVYYTIISPDVAKAEFIFCIFYQLKSSSSEGFSDGNLLWVVVIFELFLVAENQVTI